VVNRAEERKDKDGVGTFACLRERDQRQRNEELKFRHARSRAHEIDDLEPPIVQTNTRHHQEWEGRETRKKDGPEGGPREEGKRRRERVRAYLIYCRGGK
jgi:hypothetical protein